MSIALLTFFNLLHFVCLSACMCSLALSWRAARRKGRLMQMARQMWTAQNRRSSSRHRSSNGFRRRRRRQ